MRYLFLILLTCMLSPAARGAEYSAPERIDVFVISDQQVKSRLGGLAITVHTLDTVAQWERDAFHPLSSDPAAAAQQIKKQLAVMKGVDRAKLVQGWQGLLRAASLGIDRVPAIVFNSGESVVYGTTDVDLAVQVWRRWKRE